MVAGAIMVVAGVVTWFAVQTQLADENITVSDDADNFAGDPVDGMLTAYAEANVIEKHALEASGGLTYAELDREDPTRETVMTASFLRASLFTSVVAFGVALMAAGVGSCCSSLAGHCYPFTRAVGRGGDRAGSRRLSRSAPHDPSTL